MSGTADRSMDQETVVIVGRNWVWTRLCKWALGIIVWSRDPPKHWDGIECYVHVLLWCYCDKLRHNFFPICDSTSDIYDYSFWKKIRSSDQRTESTCCAVYSNLSITHILNNCCWHFIAIVISVVSDILRNKGQAIQMDDILLDEQFLSI